MTAQTFARLAYDDIQTAALLIDPRGNAKDRALVNFSLLAARALHLIATHGNSIPSEAWGKRLRANRNEPQNLPRP
jgi:hypothetical protein